MRQHNLNALICDKHLASQISECPVCVREERDHAIKDADGAVELAEALHAVQRERDRYREALRIIAANKVETDHLRIARRAFEGKS